MKNHKFSLFGLLLIVAVVAVGFLCSALAFAGTAKNVPATRAFTPSAIGYVSVTKGSTTVDVSTATAIRYITSADCTYTFNGTGAPWQVKANAPETIYLPANVKSIVFSVTSSAGTGIRTQRQ
jgi:hypothetical protein